MSSAAPPGLPLDHLLWAVPDLDAGIADFEARTGVRAQRGGAHPGRGTRNALCSFGDGRYLELIAPDPAQDLDALPADSLARRLRALAAPGLFTFAAACTDLEGQAARARARGLPFQGPVASSRLQPDGATLRWRLGHTAGTPHGRFLPFYIDWLDSPHPSATVPGGLQLHTVAMQHPQADALGALYAGLGLAMPVQAGAAPGLHAVVAGPRGHVHLPPVADPAP